MFLCFIGAIWLNRNTVHLCFLCANQSGEAQLRSGAPTRGARDRMSCEGEGVRVETGCAVWRGCRQARESERQGYRLPGRELG